VNLEDFLYWSKEDFRLNPCGSDHFDSSLGKCLRSKPAPEPPRSYLIDVNRSRTDALRDLFGGWKRSLISVRLRDGARKTWK
jgi:hypothetical protein